MTKSTSSRFASRTTRAKRSLPTWVGESEVMAEASGQLLTEESSETTSVDSTEPMTPETVWTVNTEQGQLVKVKVQGGRGRVSFSRPHPTQGGEARFYRNETTKTYDAVLTGVKAIWSDRVEVEDARAKPMPDTAIDVDTALAEVKRQLKGMAKRITRVEKKKAGTSFPVIEVDGRPWDDLSTDEQEQLFIQYGTFGDAEAAWTEATREWIQEQTADAEAPEPF